MNKAKDKQQKKFLHEVKIQNLTTAEFYKERINFFYPEGIPLG